MYVKTVSRFRNRKVIAPLSFICRGALSKSFTWSPVHTNVGLKGWSRNMRNVKLCFEDLQDYQGQPFVIASARGIKAVGIGIRLSTSIVSHEAPVLASEALKDSQEQMSGGLAGSSIIARNCICKGHQGGRHWHSQGQVRTSSR